MDYGPQSRVRVLCVCGGGGLTGGEWKQPEFYSDGIPVTKDILFEIIVAVE